MSISNIGLGIVRKTKAQILTIGHIHTGFKITFRKSVLFCFAGCFMWSKIFAGCSWGEGKTIFLQGVEGKIKICLLISQIKLRQ